MSHPSEQTTAASARRSSNAASYAGPATTAAGPTPAATAHFPSGLPRESQAGIDAIKEELRHTTTMLKSKSKQLYQKGESSNLVQLIKSKMPKSVHFEISEKRNYLLETMALVQSWASPAVEAFTKLSTTEQGLILALSVILLWLPALLALFTLVPATIFGYTAFYLYFFDTRVLQKHANEALSKATGYSPEQLYAKGMVLSKTLAHETLYHAYHLMSGNGASQWRQSGQRALAMLSSLVVLGLGALITLLARAQSLVVSMAPATASAPTAATKG